MSSCGEAASALRDALLALLGRLDRPDARPEQLQRDWEAVAAAEEHLCALAEAARSLPADERAECARQIGALVALHALVHDRARTQHELAGERIRRVRATRQRLAPLVPPPDTGERMDLAG